MVTEDEIWSPIVKGSGNGIESSSHFMMGEFAACCRSAPRRMWRDLSRRGKLVHAVPRDSSHGRAAIFDANFAGHLPGEFDCTCCLSIPFPDPFVKTPHS